MSVSRRELLIAGAGAGAFAADRSAAVRPNIVVIMADDLAAWMLGCYGNKEIRTPNIDRLARSGMRFANGFVVTPICSASRATFFTGRVPRQHGIHDFLTASPESNPPQGQAAPPPAFDKEIMISDVLAAAGYECGYAGKWHMGKEASPGHGFRFTYTTLSGGESRYVNPEMSLNGQSVRETGYLTEIITRGAGEFIDRQSAAKPFFLTVSHHNPHTPYTGHPQKYYDMYAGTSFDTIGWKPAAPNALREKEFLSDIPGNLRRVAASVTALDDQIPPLLDRLRSRGLLDNTLIVFTGDNGYLLGRHGLWSKGHASNPINMYDEVMRVPLLMSWPGKIPTDAVAPEIVSFTDVLPTLCEAAGVAPPAGRNLPGRSFLPLARRTPLPKKQPWRNIAFGHFRYAEMARDTRYKLVLRNDGAGPNELFDLSADPREDTNQYENGQYVTVRDRLAKDLAEWRSRTSA